MEEFKFCRVCLVTDVKMYSLNITSNNSIGLIYSHLAQIRICDLNQHVCFACASLLQKYQIFKSKCLRAHVILSKFTVNSTEITEEVIQSIDRKNNELESCYGVSLKQLCCIDPSDISKTEDSKMNKALIIKNQETDLAELEIKTESDKKSEELGFSEPVKDTKITTHVKLIKEPKSKKLKYEKVGVTKADEKCEANDLFDDLNDSDMIECSEDIFTETSPQKCEIDTIKEPNSKKTKVVDVASDDNLSDNEPLSKRVTKVVSSSRKSESKKNNLNVDIFDDYVTIMFLTLEDARKELLSRKESSNYKRSPFKCEHCYKGYEAEAAFENHKKKHSKEHGDYECNVCYLRFLKPIYLCKHKLSCHKRKFTCKLCPYICFCMDQARTHVSLHQGKKYPCKDCGEIFSMPNSLLMHKRMKHFDESVAENVCEFCGNTFASAWGLFLHNMKVHRTDKNSKEGPNCEECGVHFTSDVAWKRHLVLSTKHGVSNGCKYCGEQFTDVRELKCHTREHHPKQKTHEKLPAACLLCSKWLSNRVEYIKHVTGEHPQSDEARKLNSQEHMPFVCEVCGQAFKQQCFLTYHQRKHTGERPYACGTCAKTFPTAGARAIHGTVHERTRVYKCELCARHFSFKSALNKHMKIHLNIRPHKCTICDKGFIHQCDLKLHIKYVHDKVPWPKKKSKRKANDEIASYVDYN